MFLRFGIDVSEDDDVREVDPEPAEQRGHPGMMATKMARLFLGPAFTWE